jgi:hypothetical protein
MKNRAVSLGTTLVVLASAAFCSAAAISTETLLDDLIDLQRLTKLPDPAYTTKQFSSYDRASKSPSEDWFANADHGQFVRVEDKNGRKEHVMMDADGPGAIVRIWSANPQGTLRIYIDGNDTPVIESPMDRILGGRMAGMPAPLAGERAKGWNLYFPIPYAKHCKVTSDDGGFYYHVNYRTYAAGTDVQSFVPVDLERLNSKIRQIAEKLKSPRMSVPPPAERVRKLYDVKLSPGAEEKIFEIAGAKAIVGFLTHILAEDIEAAARSVVVKMTFDGNQTVESPIGDFYGTAPGLTPYASLALGITEDSVPDLWCHWWMPFARSTTVSFKNLGNQDVQLNGGVATVDYKWDDRSLHFHAGWRQEKNVPTRPFTDWVHLECTGQGRFVGGHLHIQNPVRVWWGEGDEKIYVDGETFPSHFGTGTEDYYGYAWCSPARFVHAYHNQPRCDGPGNYGNTSVNRFHIIDDIPFTKSFKFDIENWHWTEDTYTNRAAVSYWYARPGGKSFFKAITKADVILEDMPVHVVQKVEGCQEGENLEVLELTGGRTENQDLAGFEQKFSSERHLWWMDNPRPGDKLTVAFDSPDAGRKNIEVNLTKANDYAIVQLYINGKKAGEPIDLFNQRVVPTGPIDLGAFDLVKGKGNKLTVEIVGANDRAVKSYMFGLDYILVK